MHVNHKTYLKKYVLHKTQMLTFCSSAVHGASSGVVAFPKKSYKTVFYKLKMISASIMLKIFVEKKSEHMFICFSFYLNAY